VSGQASKPTAAQKTAALLQERANSNENSNDASSNRLSFIHSSPLPLLLSDPAHSHLTMNEESNTAFSEVGFDSDSNQASEQGLSRHITGSADSSSNTAVGGSTDFSAMVREEKETDKSARK
jgi:hypothetical protein